MLDDNVVHSVLHCYRVLQQSWALISLAISPPAPPAPPAPPVRPWPSPSGPVTVVKLVMMWCHDVMMALPCHLWSHEEASLRSVNYISYHSHRVIVPRYMSPDIYHHVSTSILSLSGHLLFHVPPPQQSTFVTAALHNSMTLRLLIYLISIIMSPHHSSTKYTFHCGTQ